MRRPNPPLRKERLAGDPPSTAMERHIADLVEHLRNGYDNRAGFMAAIENAQAHAFYLEKTVQTLSKEVRELDEALSIPLPRFSMDFNNDACLSHQKTWSHRIDWVIRAPFAYTVTLRDFHEQSPEDQKMWKRMRRNAFRALMKRFREEFNRCVPERLHRP